MFTSVVWRVLSVSAYHCVYFSGWTLWLVCRLLFLWFLNVFWSLISLSKCICFWGKATAPLRRIRQSQENKEWDALQGNNERGPTLDWTVQECCTEEMTLKVAAKRYEGASKEKQLPWYAKAATSVFPPFHTEEMQAGAYGLSYKDVNSVASFLLTEKWITTDVINKVSICEKENWKIFYQEHLRIMPMLWEGYIIILCCFFSCFFTSLPSHPFPPPSSSLLPHILLPSFLLSFPRLIY